LLFCFEVPAVHGDAGSTPTLVIETGRSNGNSFTLAGRDAGQQLIVTVRHAAGQVRDLTGQVRYEALPAGVVRIEPTGYVTALKEGKATIHVHGPGSSSRSIDVAVTDILRDVPVNFANEVVPIFTRFGCNSGGCH